MEIKKRRGRPPKTVQEAIPPQQVDFGGLTKLNNLDIDPRMLETMPTGISLIDEFISHEGGIPSFQVRWVENKCLNTPNDFNSLDVLPHYF